VHTVDARGLKCPLPLVKTKLALEEVEPGETVRVLATDPEAPIDLAALAADEGHGFARERAADGWRLTLTKAPPRG
jgi:tRNA 2-thiouridine synthesizing protein A